MGRRILKGIGRVLGILGGILLLALGTLASLEQCTRGDFIDKYQYKRDVGNLMRLEQEYGAILEDYDLSQDEFEQELTTWQQEWSEACDAIEDSAVDIPDEYLTVHRHIMRYCSLRLELANRWMDFDELSGDELTEMLTTLMNDLDEEAQFLSEEYDRLGWSDD